MKRILSIVLLLVATSSISGAVVSHTGKYFAVTESDRSFRVGREGLDNTLKNINKTNLGLFLKKGRIAPHKLSDGSYMLRGHVNGLGGGPMLASFSYWCVKTLCWGSVAAAGGAVVATGVGAGTALLGGGTIAGTLTGGAGAGVGVLVETGLTGAFTGGTTIVAGALGNTVAGAAVATEATAGMLAAGAGTSMGLIGFIEGLAVSAYLGAMALPTP